MSGKRDKWIRKVAKRMLNSESKVRDLFRGTSKAEAAELRAKIVEAMKARGLKTDDL